MYGETFLQSNTTLKPAALCQSNGNTCRVTQETTTQISKVNKRTTITQTICIFIMLRTYRRSRVRRTYVWRWIMLIVHTHEKLHAQLIWKNVHLLYLSKITAPIRPLTFVWARLTHSVVGILHGYTNGMVRFQQARVAHRWWWWHMAHRAAQLLLIKDGGCPAQEQGAGSNPTCARIRILEGPWRKPDSWRQVRNRWILHVHGIVIFHS
jgi:hypothetical protein